MLSLCVHVSVFTGVFDLVLPSSQLTHNVFKTLLETCAELVWDRRCSNLVATFDQIYFVWQWKLVISNVVATLQQRYLATYNVAATLFGNISPTFAQSYHSTLWKRARNYPWLRFHNFHSMLWKRCHNLKLLAGMAYSDLSKFNLSIATCSDSNRWTTNGFTSRMLAPCAVEQTQYESIVLAPGNLWIILIILYPFQCDQPFNNNNLLLNQIVEWLHK